MVRDVGPFRIRREIRYTRPITYCRRRVCRVRIFPCRIIGRHVRKIAERRYGGDRSSVISAVR